MRKKLGVLLMEEENGSIAVQLFSEPGKALDSFNNMVGTDGQKPQRATFIDLNYDEGEDMPLAQAVYKDLPAPKPEKIEAYRLGEGPIKLTEERTDDTEQG